MSFAVGIDLGGTSIKAVAVDRAGVELAREQVAFDPAVRMDWADKIRELVRRLEAGQGRAAVAVGLSAPGLADGEGRAIACMPGRLEGLEGLNWTKFLQRPSPVPVLNDAHAALLGEVWVGAARGARDVFMLTLGTGVGGAAMVEGRLLRGHIGRAGHLGHICLDPEGPPDCTGMPGSLEDAIGNGTVGRRSSGRFATTHDLVAAYLAGDAAASAVWLRSVRALGCAVGSLINVLDPEVVIIGGGVARAGAALFEPLEKVVREVEWQPAGARVRIVPAQLGEMAGAYGAASQALRGAE
ncbi:MAG TPA: ROK family protein [Methylomirabilota bacterium]|nr:ROK family protein [Methylomirabilota bacterium]